MMRFISNTFEGGIIKLDGAHYENCIFKNCDIRFGGTAPFGLVGCRFDSCRWTLEGPASNTIEFLRLMYKDMGDFGKQMVEATFENIKK
ncbi:TPA: hypothetical protein ACW71V_004066 [Klebsiella aerogenes]|jgi:hypothetical protein|uniref:hypothetical protein n=1 Tax=Klebsiella aerogenes TaxID=548 RepID=UPI00044D6113|nr:hypothetical protein [Klebsiella aerogenes]DAM02127.1 MAG TPA: neurotoxin [Caudoviricetes sp.]EIV6705582.1 hypothetical protein [Klebsiella aerogenes]EIV9529923.1 hypothetical protein [Klebsiella aerogenes]EKU8837646.1 hypothetical protein [Klebsiella aerogenes]EKV6366999.1 hypothetical protein [Klebsiella aerogenes]